MAGSVNSVTLVGNLARDPEIRSLGSGEKIANLTVVTSETWRDKNSGERKEKAEFHRVVIFNENLVKVAESYLKKGSLIYLTGSLATRKWTDQQGVEKYSTEIVLQKFRGELTMLGGKPEDSDTGRSSSRSGGGGSEPVARGGGGRGSRDLDDDLDSIPFVIPGDF